MIAPTSSPSSQIGPLPSAYLRSRRGAYRSVVSSSPELVSRPRDFFLRVLAKQARSSDRRQKLISRPILYSVDYDRRESSPDRFCSDPPNGRTGDILARDCTCVADRPRPPPRAEVFAEVSPSRRRLSETLGDALSPAKANLLDGNT